MRKMSLLILALGVLSATHTIADEPAPKPAPPAAVCVHAARANAKPNKPSSDKEVQINFRLLEGDPLGSPELGTQRVLSGPRVTTLDQQCATVFISNEMPILAALGVRSVLISNERPNPADHRQSAKSEPGFGIECEPHILQGGKIQLDLLAEFSKLEKADGNDVPVLETVSARTSVQVQKGQVVKLRLGEGTFNKQRWVEVSAEEITPQK